MAILYYLGLGLARVCFSTFARWEVEGREGVPPLGRLLVVANHQSNADPPVLMASLPRRIRYVAKRELFDHPVVSTALRAWGAYPLERTGQGSGALRWLIRGLEQEQAIGIFPEGTRSLGGMRKASYGVAFAALKTHATILPVGITGTENMTTHWRIPFPFCTIRVNIGQPFSLPLIEGKLEDAQLDSLTEMIMMRVAMLLPEEYRGVYGRVASHQSA